jgi:serine protease Do
VAQELGVDGSGVVVTEVEAGGVAQMKGIQKGDVIREVNRQPVTRVEEVNALLSHREAGAKVLLRITREGAARYVVVSPDG